MSACKKGSAHDSARATAPGWWDVIGAWLHLRRHAAVWPDTRWVDHDADAGLRVQCNARSPLPHFFRIHTYYLASMFFTGT